MKKILVIGVLVFMIAFAGVSLVSAEIGYGGSSSGNRLRRVMSAQNPTVVSQGSVLGASTFTFADYQGRGASSDAVKQLQERLRAEGFFTYVISTGYFGPITFAAVQAYQTSHGIPSTGFVGPLTIAELNK
jgi:peptidoglycan hydrolase-like protein with peptidoglycan-binding domain